VLIAFVVAARTRWPEAGWSALLGRMRFAEDGFSHIAGVPGIALGTAIVVAVAALLYRAGRPAPARP
jgi:hypothetical protein